MHNVIQTLLTSEEPAIRYKVRAKVVSSDKPDAETLALQREIKLSLLVAKLLSERNAAGEIPWHAYDKWAGAHWALSLFADLDYPPGDEGLLPLRKQVYGWILSERHKAYFPKRFVAGRMRMHPSQEGNVIYALIKLGLATDAIEELVARLLKWQWPDGGWNCDMNPGAGVSSFTESLVPLRGLIHYHQYSGDPKIGAVIEQAAEVFLQRQLYKRLRDGEVIDRNFVLLHYPCYWHYDILFGLKVMAEAGFINDPRCAAALDLLESKRLPDGGFPAEARYYRVTDDPKAGSRSTVDWGGASKKKLNEFVAVDALYVLKEAGRLHV
jgi:hypothetical protein